MDFKKIGCFLKKLRQEKGVTQEQLAEDFGVSSRTVSRWETGTNMPDITILVQIAEYYDVDINEILNGERKSESMDSKLKETLLKVADYSELEKKKALQAGNVAFILMFAICTAIIAIQMVLTVDLKFVVGETAAVIFGGIAYIWIMVQNGLWEMGSKAKNTLSRDVIISVLCAVMFSAVYALCIFKMGAEGTQLVRMTAVFFVGIMVIGFGVLRLLAYINKKQRENDYGK